MEEPATIEVDGVRLEARLAKPSSPAGGVVLCHPHPLYGGDMDNPVVLETTEVCRAAGLATLRFNFRGVGRSTGVHAEGNGERADVSAALALLGGLLGVSVPLATVGYSFGAWVGSQVATADGRVGSLVAIAPPLAFYDFDGLGQCRGTVLLIAGSEDPYCPREKFEGLAARLPRARSVLIEGADHFFAGKLDTLGEAIAAWARSFSEASAGKAGGGCGPN